MPDILCDLLEVINKHYDPSATHQMKTPILAVIFLAGCSTTKNYSGSYQVVIDGPDKSIEKSNTYNSCGDLSAEQSGANYSVTISDTRVPYDVFVNGQREHKAMKLGERVIIGAHRVELTDTSHAYEDVCKYPTQNG